MGWEVMGNTAAAVASRSLGSAPVQKLNRNLPNSCLAHEVVHSKASLCARELYERPEPSKLNLGGNSHHAETLHSLKAAMNK
jgi:hypothetical protein